jgi:hypothetical protein
MDVGIGFGKGESDGGACGDEVVEAGSGREGRGLFSEDEREGDMV